MSYAELLARVPMFENLADDDRQALAQSLVERKFTAGEHLGEIALFDDRPRSASAVATTDATLLELDRDTLSRYLAQRPQGAMTLLRTLAARLRATNEMLSQRAAKNVVAELE